MKEVYKTVWEFPNYEVSNLGNFRKCSGKSIKPYVNRNAIGVGLVVKFNQDGKWIRRSAGVVVAEAFVPNPRGYKHLIYKNHDILDFCSNNLEWVSGETVMYHRIKRKPGRSPKKENREEQIKKIERNIDVAQLFLGFLKKNDIKNLNQIVLLFDKEIRGFISKWTRVQEKQEDCYQYTICSFLENVDRNIMVSANIEAYLRGIVRNYFLMKWKEKKKHKEVCYNDCLMHTEL